MPVKETDPGAVELDQAFKAAMEGPAKPREAPPPPPIDPDAPFGHDDDGQPKAPYGRKSDGTIRRSGGGRPPRNERARTGEVVRPPDKPRGKQKPKEVPPHQDYSGPLGELADSIWLGLNGLSMVGPHIPVVGKFLPEEKLAAEAFIFHQNKPNLVKAFQLAADHNAGAARFCAKIAKGEATWVLMAGFSIMPFFVQTAAVLKGDDALAKMSPDASLKSLATMNRQLMDAYMAELKQMAQAQAAEMTEPGQQNGQPPE